MPRGEMCIWIWGWAELKDAKIGDLRKALDATNVNLYNSTVAIDTSAERSLLHAPRATRPVAVMKIETFALKYECADAILKEC